MPQDLTELDYLCIHLEEALNPEEIIDVLGLDSAQVVDLCRGYIAQRMEELWEATT